MARIAFTVEGGAIKSGYAIKNGTAELGIVIGTADSVNMGVALGNAQAEESHAIGEQLAVALIGEDCLCIAGGAITKGVQCISDAAGKFVVIGGGSNGTVLSMEAAAAGEVFRAIVISQG